MEQLTYILDNGIGLFVFVPLFAFLLTLFWQNRQEKPIARIVLLTKAFYIVASLGYAGFWIANGLQPVDVHFMTLYETEQFVFAIRFYYDLATAVFSIVGAILFYLVCTFSRYYMHRDEGFKRFFNTVLFFSMGYNLIVFSGNFETMFIGWEIAGLSSFLLIAFYRNRYLPVKNAYKALSNYRVSDIALMLAMWMMHHLTHQNISFTQLVEAKQIAILQNHEGMAAFIVLMFILAAMIKSAQVPFTSWLPRAMEGPTSSTAIFYGSLSVHIGVFVLIRTYPFWENMVWAKALIITVGAITAAIATHIARVQPTVKTQIAYSSAAQIGIIFIEVALGYNILALVHFAGNAFLRTYQLLVSPSVLNYLVHHQYFHYHPPGDKPVSSSKALLFILGIKEWNLDQTMTRFLWEPFKWAGRQLERLSGKIVLILIVAVLIPGLLFLTKLISLPAQASTGFSILYLGIALALILVSFVSRGSATKAWRMLFVAHWFILCGVYIGTGYTGWVQFVMYASGITAAYIAGVTCLISIRKIDNDINLNNFHGYVYEQKNAALLFLVSVIALIGFPVTTAFIGIDELFTYIKHEQYITITLLALCFLFIELAAIRIYLRIFLGPHKKTDHPVAFRSS